MTAAAITGPIFYVNTDVPAVRGPGSWDEIHRPVQWVFLDSGNTRYLAACGARFESPERRPVPLASGYYNGAACSRCFGALVRGAA